MTETKDMTKKPHEEPTDGEQPFPVNHGLITQTCLSSADMFLSRVSEKSEYCERIAGLFDLLSVAEAAILYDSLWFLKGSKDSTKPPGLAEDFQRAKLLKELQPTALDREVSSDVAAWIAETCRNETQHVRLLNADEAFKLSMEDLTGEKEDETGRSYWRMLRDLDSPWHSPRWADEAAPYNEQTIQNLGVTIARNLGETATGCVERGISLTRTVFYWTLSYRQRLGLSLETARVPLALSLFKSFYQSLSHEAYEHLAKAFHSSVAQLFDLENASIIYIPPFASLVLDKCNGPQTFVDSVLSVREEFTELRRQFVDCERRRYECKSIKELASLHDQVCQWFFQLDRSFSPNTDVSILERGMPYVEDALKPLSNPSDISSYSTLFVKKPLEWVRQWWLKRPISHLFSLKDRLFSLRDYAELAERAFGCLFTAQELHNFREFQTRWERIPFSRLEAYRSGTYWRTW